MSAVAVTAAASSVATAVVGPGGQTDWTDLLSLVTAVVALGIAGLALLSESRSRRKDELARLVAYFDDSGLFVRMWRMDQATRGENGRSEIGTADIHELLNSGNEARVALIRGALANDWSADRADMYSMYFFAYRLRAWCTGWFGQLLHRRIRELNQVFGHQLFATFVNHQVVACRLRNGSEPPGYYPTHYGLFDRQYSELVSRLGNELLNSGRLTPGVEQPLRDRWQNLQLYLTNAEPVAGHAEPPEPQKQASS